MTLNIFSFIVVFRSFYFFEYCSPSYTFLYFYFILYCPFLSFFLSFFLSVKVTFALSLLTLSILSSLPPQSLGKFFPFNLSRFSLKCQSFSSKQHQQHDTTALHLKHHINTTLEISEKRFSRDITDERYI